jgi:hypothetical protein
MTARCVFFNYAMKRDITTCIFRHWIFPLCHKDRCYVTPYYIKITSTEQQILAHIFLICLYYYPNHLPYK